MGLIKTILIFAIVYYLIKKVGGFFLKTIAGEGSTQQEQKRRGFTYTNTHKSTKEGEVHIKTSTQKKSDNDYKGGEYVDFEELDE